MRLKCSTCHLRLRRDDEVAVTRDNNVMHRSCYDAVFRGGGDGAKPGAKPKQRNAAKPPKPPSNTKGKKDWSFTDMLSDPKVIAAILFFLVLLGMSTISKRAREARQQRDAEEGRRLDADVKRRIAQQRDARQRRRLEKVLKRRFAQLRERREGGRRRTRPYNWKKNKRTYAGNNNNLREHAKCIAN